MIVNPAPGEQPIDWTVRDQPLYGPPAAAVPPPGWPPTEPLPPTSAPPGSYVPAPGPTSYWPPTTYPTPSPQVVYVQKLPRTGLAVAALVLMLLSITGSLCLFSWLPAVAAVLCGHYALREVKASNGALRGRDMAIWSLIGAYPVAGFWTVGVIYMVATRSFGTSL